MPLLNFKKMFVDPIRKKRKRHTIRAWRKIPITKGDKLYLYCGLRQKGAFRILPEPVKCVRAEPIEIHVRGWESQNEITINGVALDDSEKEQLARADGFDSLKDMMNFWLTEHGDVYGPLHMRAVHFEGQIIHW